MLKTSRSANHVLVECLTQLWAERYVPDLSILSPTTDSFALSELIEAASPEGRTKTVAKLQRMVEINCKCAGIQTNVIFSYIPSIVSLTEAQGIAKVAGQVYLKALDFYQKQPIPPHLLTTEHQQKTIDLSADTVDLEAMPKLSLSEVQQLAIILEPLLDQFQKQHLSAIDRRAIGFMSTQFHLTAKLILKRLTTPEQLLLSPYFKFIEEQVCIPWQRICAAAVNHEPDSLHVAIVKKMLPASQSIAQRVYRRAVRAYPAHHSRRGSLIQPGVRASSIRDIEMFQGYLWLCLLEESMASVEEELLPLCLMVFPNIDVTWELVEQLMPLLTTEIQGCLSPEQADFLKPYTRRMQQIFSNLEAKAAQDSSALSCPLK
jgi:hypothetical protein